jgi:Protein of unknown function (DUF2829)
VTTYIGTKLIRAQAMSRAEYNAYRGWTLPADENGEDAGYLVEYLDGGQSNHPNHVGYISWSPADVFERAYRPTTGLSFGMAIEALKLGERVARAGWNGKGMWLAMIQRASWQVDPTVNKKMGAHSLNALPWIGMKTVDAGFVPWLASQTDMLADDWMIVE